MNDETGVTTESQRGGGRTEVGLGRVVGCNVLGKAHAACFSRELRGKSMAPGSVFIQRSVREDAAGFAGARWAGADATGSVGFCVA